MKQAISVREKGDWKNSGKEIEVINRTLRAEAMGNFNPIFCQYNYKQYLVHSEDGDLSDPFRREFSYLKTLYIEI